MAGLALNVKKKMPREQSLVRDQGGGQGVQGGGGGGLERNNNSEGKGIFIYIYNMYNNKNIFLKNSWLKLCK